MGVADVIPGVSGGTIALITGIYNDLIQSLSQCKVSKIVDAYYFFNPFVEKIKKEKAKQNLLEVNWFFLIFLFGGVGGAILLMSTFVSTLLEHYPEYCFSFFFGLITFSLPPLFREVNRDFKNFFIIVFFASLMLMLLFSGVNLEGSTQPFYIFLSGALGICAMILPGISGAYILIILGEYKIILEALHNKNFFIILIFMLGMGVGLYFFLRVLKYFLDNHRSMLIASMIGIMLGGLKKIWPYSYVTSETLPNTLHIYIVALIILGAIIAFLLDKLGQHKKLRVKNL